ncbi:hypothetical protein GXB81_17405 [Paraburkholderia sp. Ac-20336]|uniref:hypothetical protein n=1 Tax=Paraburkholderia sp. Ac-20336 TaxID=2703886 RepID=UPI00197E6812|nr:hypothetical protein [Paraburkholderia sp. Ac-20336]MBN3804813.1 hypothetical protein [Paraburkholderia sp. Ac-20336]
MSSSRVESYAMRPMGGSVSNPEQAAPPEPVEMPQDVAAKTTQRSSGGVLGSLARFARPASTTLNFGLFGSRTTARPTGPRAPVNADKPRTEGTGTHGYGLFGVAQHALSRFTGVSGKDSAYTSHEQIKTRAGMQRVVAAEFGIGDISTVAADAPLRRMLDTLAGQLVNHEHVALAGLALARVCNGDAMRASAACDAMRNPAAATPDANRDAFAMQRALVNGGNGLDAVRMLRHLPDIRDQDRVGHAAQSQALNTQMNCAERLLQRWPPVAGPAPDTVEELIRMINTALPAGQRQADIPTDAYMKPSLQALATSIEGRALVASAVLLKNPGAKLEKNLGKAYLPARNNIFDEAQVRDFSAEMFGMLRDGLNAAAAGSMLGLGTVVNSTPLTSLKQGTGGQMMREPKADFLEFQQAAVRSIGALVGGFDPAAAGATLSPDTIRNMVRAFAVAAWCKQVGTQGWADTHRFSADDRTEIARTAQQGLGITHDAQQLRELGRQVGALESVDLKTLGAWLGDVGIDVSPGTEHGDRLASLNRFERHGNTFAGGQLDTVKLNDAVTAVAAHLRAAPGNALENELRASALEYWTASSSQPTAAGHAQGWTRGTPLSEHEREELVRTVAGKLGRTVDDVKHSAEFAQIGPMGVDTLRAWARHGGITNGPVHDQLAALTSGIEPDADDFVDGVRAAIMGARTTYPVIMQRTERMGFNMNVPLAIRKAMEDIKPALPKMPGESADMSLLMGPDVAVAGSRVRSVVAGSTAIAGSLDVTRGYGVGGHAGWATVATANIGAPQVVKAQGTVTGQLWMNGDATVSKGWTLRSRMVSGQPEAWRTQLLAGYDAMFGRRGDRPATPEDLFDRLCEQHAANPELSISPLEVTRYSGGPSFTVTVGLRGDANNWKPGVSLSLGGAASYTASGRGDVGAGTIRTSIANNTFAASATTSASIAVGVPTVSKAQGPVATISFPSIPVVGASVVTVPVARGGTARISTEDGKIAPTTVWDDESVRVQDLTVRTERPERRRSWIASLGGGAEGERKLNAFLNLCEGEADKGNLLIADRQIITPVAVEKINTLLSLREIHVAGAATTPEDRARYDECSRAISAILQANDSWKNRFLYLLENTVIRDVVGPDTVLTAQTVNEVLTPHQLHALPAEN